MTASETVEMLDEETAMIEEVLSKLHIKKN
jgi:hypothetical protein